MSLIKLQGNASGTGAFTIAAPNSNTDRTLTLPDATGTVVTANGSGDIATTSITPSAGIYLGGSGSANLLDDYEEGTWSSTISGVTATQKTVTGYYTKVGNVVTINGVLSVSGYSGGSGNSNFTLPFAPRDNVTAASGMPTTFNTINAAYIYVSPYQGTTTAFIYTNGEFALPGANWTNGQIVFNGSYLTA